MISVRHFLSTPRSGADAGDPNCDGGAEKACPKKSRFALTYDKFARLASGVWFAYPVMVGVAIYVTGLLQGAFTGVLFAMREKLD